MNVAFVLHSHLPWVRRNGVHPAGEEWFFQAVSESYLPLLDTLERLAADGHRDLLTLGITPILAEQLSDAHLLGELHGWLGRRLSDLQWTESRYGAPDRERMRGVWRHHWARQVRLLETLETRILPRGSVVAPFADLAEAGVIQLLGGPHTHTYLALADDPTLIRGQMAGGMAVAEASFGRRPRGVWTPECAYRPAGTVADPTRPPLEVAGDGTPTLHRGETALEGLETFWAEAGVDHLVLDGPTLARAGGVGRWDWAMSGGAILPPGGPLDVLDRPVEIDGSGVAAFGRNLSVSYAVWNPHGGYPSDPAYRDFHDVDLEGGFKHWRVTDVTSPDKAPYEPLWARERAIAHAHDFIALCHQHLDARGEDAVVVAAYDTELFGHWWYEGPTWLEAVLTRLADDPRLCTTTLEGHLDRYGTAGSMALPESSWGWGKGHGAWVTEATRWMWTELRDAEAILRTLEAGPRRDAAWRQLSLAAASDWPFMVVRDQSARYACERVRTHLDRFAAAVRGDLEGLAEIDDPNGTAAPLLGRDPEWGAALSAG